MRQTGHIQTAPLIGRRVTWRIRNPLGAVTMILWTPDNPREIADHLRPLVFGGIARPLLRGRLGSRSMRIQRRLAHNPEYPRLAVEYEQVSDGTLMFGTIESTPMSRVRLFIFVLIALMLMLIALANDAFAIAATIAVISIGIYLVHSAVKRSRYRHVGRWYKRLLVDRLSAEDMGSDL